MFPGSPQALERLLMSSFLQSSEGGVVRIRPVSETKVFFLNAHYLGGRAPRDWPFWVISAHR